jgi:hypothetical protein
MRHIRACEPPLLLRTGARSVDLDGEHRDWIVEVRLTDDGDGTILRLQPDPAEAGAVLHIGSDRDNDVDRLMAAGTGAEHRHDRL